MESHNKASSLTLMPNDILYHIGEFLLPEQVIHFLAPLCSSLRKCFVSNEFWEPICTKQGIPTEKASEIGFYRLYVQYAANEAALVRNLLQTKFEAVREGNYEIIAVPKHHALTLPRLTTSVTALGLHEQEYNGKKVLVQDSNILLLNSIIVDYFKNGGVRGQEKSEIPGIPEPPKKVQSEEDEEEEEEFEDRTLSFWSTIQSVEQADNVLEHLLETGNYTLGCINNKTYEFTLSNGKKFRGAYSFEPEASRKIEEIEAKYRSTAKNFRASLLSAVLPNAKFYTTCHVMDEVEYGVDRDEVFAAVDSRKIIICYMYFSRFYG